MTRFASITAFVLFILYGAASHFFPDDPLVAGVALAAACMFAGMAAAKRRWWLPALIGVAAVALLVRFDPHWVIYVPPVLLNGLAATYFFTSLYTSRLSVIERIILLVHGAEQPRFRGYARKLTVVWGALLASIALTAALLALLGMHYWWSLFSNLLAFLIMVGFSVVEYIFRRFYFPDHKSAGPLRIAAIVRERGLAYLARREP